MVRFVDEGKIRYIGVSNFSLEQLKKAQEALPNHEMVSNQVEYSLMARLWEWFFYRIVRKTGLR